MATDKEKVWLAEYYKCFNATKAARIAGFKWPDKQGQEKKAKFAAEIKQHLDELQMSADEALIRLSEQARGDLGEFTDIKLFEDLKDHPKSHLIKKLTTDVYEDKNGKLHYKTYFELHDPQPALVNVLKVHGRFKDIHSITTFAFPAELWPHATPDENTALTTADGPQMMAIAAAIQARLAGGGQAMKGQE